MTIHSYRSPLLTGATLFHHDTPEGNYSSRPISVAVDFTYEIDMNQLVALIDVSHSCRQYMRMATFSILPLINNNQWMTRQEKWTKDWGTPTTREGGCSCSLTKGMPTLYIHEDQGSY